MSLNLLVLMVWWLAGFWVHDVLRTSPKSLDRGAVICMAGRAVCSGHSLAAGSLTTKHDVWVYFYYCCVLIVRIRIIVMLVFLSLRLCISSRIGSRGSTRGSSSHRRNRRNQLRQYFARVTIISKTKRRSDFICCFAVWHRLSAML